MEVGKKTFGITVAVLCTLFGTQIVCAISVVDIYKKYDMNYTIPYPDKTLDTIRKYTESQKSVYKYHYIETSKFDKTRLRKREKSLKQRTKELKEELLGAYDMSVDAIYELENEYVECVRELENIKSALKTQSKITKDEEQIDTPTDAEYEMSLHVKDIYDSRANLGDVIKPTNSACIIKESNDTETTFLTVRGSMVHPIWNGEVVHVDTDTGEVVVYHYNKVYTVYHGLSKIIVNVGDRVTQDTEIGKSSRELVMKLRLDGTFVDCSKLYEGGD